MENQKVERPKILREAIKFFATASHTRTFTTLSLLLLVALVPLTMYVGQQRQTLKQNASVGDSCTTEQSCPAGTSGTETCTGTMQLNDPNDPLSGEGCVINSCDSSACFWRSPSDGPKGCLVEGVNSAECPSDNECKIGVCSNTSTCVFNDKAQGETCTGGVCDGSGNCVPNAPTNECDQNNPCPQGKTCQNNKCVTSTPSFPSCSKVRTYPECCGDGKSWTVTEYLSDKTGKNESYCPAYQTNPATCGNPDSACGTSSNPNEPGGGTNNNLPCFIKNDDGTCNCDGVAKLANPACYGGTGSGGSGSNPSDNNQGASCPGGTSAGCYCQETKECEVGPDGKLRFKTDDEIVQYCKNPSTDPRDHTCDPAVASRKGANTANDDTPVLLDPKTGEIKTISRTEACKYNPLYCGSTTPGSGGSTGGGGGGFCAETPLGNFPPGCTPGGSGSGGTSGGGSSNKQCTELLGIKFCTCDLFPNSAECKTGGGGSSSGGGKSGGGSSSGGGGASGGSGKSGSNNGIPYIQPVSGTTTYRLKGKVVNKGTGSIENLSIVPASTTKSLIVDYGGIKRLDTSGIFDLSMTVKNPEKLDSNSKCFVGVVEIDTNGKIKNPDSGPFARTPDINCKLNQTTDNITLEITYNGTPTAGNGQAATSATCAVETSSAQDTPNLVQFIGVGGKVRVWAQPKNGSTITNPADVIWPYKGTQTYGSSPAYLLDECEGLNYPGCGNKFNLTAPANEYTLFCDVNGKTVGCGGQGQSTCSAKSTGALSVSGGSLAGEFKTATCQTFAGWARSLQDTNATATVKFILQKQNPNNSDLAQDVTLGTSTANSPYNDIPFSDKSHGFSFNSATAINGNTAFAKKRDVTAFATASVQGQNVTTSLGIKTVTCGAAANTGSGGSANGNENNSGVTQDQVQFFFQKLGQ